MPSRTLLATAALMALLGMQRAHAADEAVAQAGAPAQPSAPAQPAAQSAAAAKADKGDGNSGAVQVEQVIVTGTARREGLRKLDASFSITTADEEQIRQAAPSSTADLLKIVPGVYVETSGGQAGANMRVRGFPTPGDGPYSTFQVNGSPLYALPTLSFFEHSQLFRLDDTIERVEVLRGGPSPIFSAGQPGITVNFIQKEAGAVPEGGLRLTTGTGNLRRMDGVFSAPLGNDWGLMVGGFYRTSDGIRDTQFPADRGGQFSAVLTRKLEDGKFMLYARAMNEKNAFYTAIPVVQSPDGSSASSYPGFDALRGYFYSNEMRNLVLETGRQVGTDANGNPIIQRETVQRDLATGRGATVQTYGLTLDKKFGDWTIGNKTNLTTGSVPTYAIFSGTNPTTIGAYINAQAAENGATGGSATFVNGGGAITDLNLPVIRNGMWAVDKDLRSFTSETRLSRELGAGNTVTVGLYLADYSAHDQWVLGQAQLMTVEPHARLVDVSLNNGMQVSHNGFVPPPFSFNLDAHWNGTTTAVYVADEWKVNDKLRLDGGVRFERQRLEGTIANVSSGDLDGDATTLWNNNLSYFNGTTSSLSSKLSRTSLTAGANFNFTREFSVFARANNGYRMPDFDVIRGRGANETRDPVEDIQQYEIGLKTATPLYTAFLTGYYATLKNSQTQQFTNAGSEVLRPNSRTLGVEFEASVRPVKGLELALTGNWQNAEYRNFSGVDGNGNPFDFSSNTIERQPKWQYRFTPSYRLPTDLGTFRVYGTYSYVGERFANAANTVKLPKYATVDAGVVASFANGIDVRLSGTNLTNKIGLTEGNFRDPNAPPSADGVILARPIFGRAWELSVGFVF
ncbi:TonB-dependent receptor [Ideonella sp. BN130291]|uniref:TonB-dependent receptor n=1 Tax=Ideonella sp. BN130291 TaxID=3112940 RepID=UPI002E2673A4|nr:TonB-dependent receptor [Ideonella sp. BN130291]